jgi:DNA polymerase-3 subunit epsilon
LTGLLARWLDRGGDSAAAARWVVVDCETSGLDTTRDRLISIGAVTVTAQRIRAGDGFEVLVRQEQPSSPQNILVHGIGAAAQSSGTPLAQALQAFFAYAGAFALVAYHASFDRSVLERAAASTGARWRRDWLDLARLLPVLFSDKAKRCKDLDAWLAEFGIVHPARHEALGDAYATAQLFQIALARALGEGAATVGQVMSLARAGRWMGGS